MTLPDERSTAEPGIIKSDETLFLIIAGLNDLGAAGVTELADYTGLTKSTVHKHLNTMSQHRYVIDDDGVYRLGFKFLNLGGNIRSENRLANAAEKTVKDLADETNELVAFTVKDYDKGVFVFRENHLYGLENKLPVGSRFYLHQNAAGKAILAELSREEVQDIIGQQGMPMATENTIENPDDLFTELAMIRDREYALNREERHEDINAIGVAVSDPTSNTLGALSLAGPTNRLTKQTLKEKYVDTLLTKANELKLKLEYGS